MQPQRHGSRRPYERLLSDLRSRWTTDIGMKAVEAIGVLEQRADRLEASLNRETAGLSGRSGASERRQPPRSAGRR
jgi:hypothetical protein